MKKFMFSLFILATSLFAYSQDPCEFIQMVQNYQDSAKLVMKGHGSYILPQSFNIKTYLAFFDKIRFDKEYTIGLYYLDYFTSGKPYIYSLKDTSILENKKVKDIYKILEKDGSRARNHIIPNNSESGFLQYLFFYVMGEQFALKWHENYKQMYLICSEEKLKSVVADFRKTNKEVPEGDTISVPDFFINLKELAVFENVDPTIRIFTDENNYQISWIENRTHDSIYRCTYMIQKRAPYKIKKISEDKLLNIACTILY